MRRRESIEVKGLNGDENVPFGDYEKENLARISENDTRRRSKLLSKVQPRPTYDDVILYANFCYRLSVPSTTEQRPVFSLFCPTTTARFRLSGFSPFIGRFVPLELQMTLTLQRCWNAIAQKFSSLSTVVHSVPRFTFVLLLLLHRDIRINTIVRTHTHTQYTRENFAAQLIVNVNSKR